ncbi:hypothetical protein [Kutzneria kofuensis]|uniref:Putative lipoprotein with Yx(FWY)xxD motif n=1 Tax=Kutzneria kofuensis TaxID=103725 RepID=A0A7W9NK54_9PSEU|nr:hypothetical protein [Kutzneria kofuensis]MBB5894878.1 putative lipoprotein with Yx(FWY)xxD motif [Kutzneria kofuensis]
MNRTRVLVLATSAAFGLATVVACGGNATQSAGGPPAQPTTQQQTDPNQVKLTATTVGQLGQVVTDAAGMTLYRFEGDSSNPPASHCNDKCAKDWPPALATSSTATLDGIDQSLVGVILRADGTKQLTINGWAVYRYAKDAAPGDAKGQGVMQKWYAITPQGKKAAGAPVTGAGGTQPTSSTKQQSPTTSIDPGAGGYGY